MTWDEVLKQEDLIGGFLVAQEGRNTFTGPVASIVAKRNGNISVKCEWMAIKAGNEWRHWEANRPYEACMEISTPRRLDDGTITFDIELIGVVNLLPKGRVIVKRNEVKGLEAA